VYASSWIKRYYPAAFCAALLNAQPMGFYSPHTLVQDARRHGVEVRTPDVNVSAAKAALEWTPAPVPGAAPVRHSPDAPQPAVRLGLSSVRGVGDDLADQLHDHRDEHGPYTSMEDVKRRLPVLKLDLLEALATAGAFDSLVDTRGRSIDRRRALWAAGAVAQSGADRLQGVVTGADAPTLPGMSERELASADLWSTGVAFDGHPTKFVRAHLDELGVVTAIGLRTVEPGSRVLVAGLVTHRQRPATAGGTTFLNLEDETGLVNVVCSQGCWSRYRRVARSAPAMVIRGRLERSEGVVNVVADKLESLPIREPLRSRDFR
jgi:error-prone DNA polymerase